MATETILTEQEVMKMIKPGGFIAAWFKLLKHCKNYTEAYESCEDAYQKRFGYRKYKNYESFRQIKTYHLKKQ
jgi:hypothetical protein